MRHQSLTLTHKEKRRGLVPVLCVLLILALSQAAFAQSGRRQRQSGRDVTPPVVTTEAEANPEVEVKKTTTVKPDAVATLIVVGDTSSSSLVILPGYLSTAVDACVKRLSLSAALNVTAGGSMSRGQAVAHAKRQKEAFVVWMEAVVEDARGSSNGMAIDYAVFTPETAKVKMFGRVYLETGRAAGGRIGVNLPTVTNTMPLGYLMKEAGQEVAERIMDKFHVRALDR